MLEEREGVLILSFLDEQKSPVVFLPGRRLRVGITGRPDRCRKEDRDAENQEKQNKGFLNRIDRTPAGSVGRRRAQIKKGGST
jgi:hypothetical protein